ncbi:MAG: serine/threonine-protein kinase [Sandaracinaceae bacterium]|nr:MAG: serine/threonine protein kinase [Sandaracinaceae bacterium]
MRICPTCRTAYPARGRATCANDGTRLVGAEEFAASKNDPLLGRLVAGRFQVIERIGTGGMGTVYRAEQSGLDRPVALKVLKSELVSDRETVARFHREAKAMSMLMHPNTVRVFDFGEDEEGHLFLAMELLEGELLTAWIEREGTPPIEQAMRTIQEILRSLAEAHSKGIIHRDLKPDNIFLARVEGHSRPVVKVLDFGIAKVFREDHQIDQLETQAGTVFGTPRYMSPEQAQGKTLDHRSDLYTVGTLLYQLLTGQPPFVDDDAVVVMAKHIRETPPSPRMAVPERPIPRSLDKLAMRALGKEPDDRFENAEQMEARLMACLPDVEREAAGRGGGLLGGLPKLPLAIGGALILLATAFAVTIVISSAPDEIAEAADRVSPPPTEVSAPPPTPPPAVRSVRLVSEPEGARVLQGDQPIGTTPLSLDVMDEPLAVTLELDGYEPMDVALTGETTEQRVALTARPDERTTQARVEPIAQPSEEPRPRRGRPSTTESESPPEPAGETPPSSGDPYERFEF